MNPTQNGSANMNHWIMNPCAWHRGEIFVVSEDIADIEMSVATLVSMLPTVA